MRQEFSKETKRARYEFTKGCCEDCGISLARKVPEYHHVLDCWLGGDNSFENCRVLCSVCHKPHTKKGAGSRAKTKRIRDRKIGIKKSRSRPIAGSKASGLKKKFDGTVIRR